ncbi:hypothetical protein QDX25_01925 [Auritidibacter ignavus]|uniref:hypothetical protein n=1 Tax=Auritidibacter ignavus TaxID=678932 RepID=UPI00244CCBE7|nr:hypothetical protein [Auritidibacter ignavus]WGH81954.1 hypothetical protein QDX25_01925 [Auritidibacter ignavus]WGH86564.1 hypothetical protein QDX24_01745 [Auritidibacter ignavus]WGH88850.1 hypothetical protein QDX22_01745 [Auritidibacter ignavus]WGH91154.1 hypothetical protein QDX23_01890 [Auritidibacter ignavus]WHS35000.1 hypothetical protein QM403_00015 [Auritidibacter ignavus]
MAVLPGLRGLGLAEGVVLVGVFHLSFGACDEDRGAVELLVVVPGSVAPTFNHELGCAGVEQGAFAVVVILLGLFATGVVGVEVGVDTHRGRGVDEGLVGAVVGDATEGDAALAGVVGLV